MRTGGNTMEEKSIRDMVEEMTELKYRQRELSNQLTQAIVSEPVLIDALEKGLIKLNFPAPVGFYRRLKRKY